MRSGNEERKRNKKIRTIILSLIIVVAIVLFSVNYETIAPTVAGAAGTVVSIITGDAGGELLLTEEEREALEKERQERRNRLEFNYNLYFTGEDTIASATEVILSVDNPSFYCSKPVDDSFVMWFVSRFGEQALDKVVQGAYHGGDASVWHNSCGEYFNAMWLKYCKQTGLHPDELENVTFIDTYSDDRVVLSFTGDMNFDDRMGTMKKLKSEGLEECISSDIRKILQDSDITMINNECPYTTEGEPLEGKAYTFRADPKNISILQDLGVDIVGIANNHMCDYGLEGVSRTVEYLDKAGIPHVGAGHNIEEASRPYYFVANGVKIAIVAATQIERSLNYTKEATATAPGVLKCLTPDKFNAVIEEADANADVVIAFVHWGTENDPKYAPDQIRLAESFVAHGADVIIGGHTHCLQGISYVDNTPVIYSLGNFWFGSTATDGVSERNTGIAQVVIEYDGTINFRFVPCVQREQSTYMCDGDMWRQVIDYEKSLSTGIDIDIDGYVHRVYE